MADGKEIEIKIKTAIDTADSAKSLGDIKKSLKDLKSMALEVGEGGKGFKQLAQQANALQDKLDDLKDSAKSLQGTGIEKLKSSFGLLTESFKNADFGKAQTAFKGLGSAMKAVPIFLIIEGIMYLVENFDKLSKGSGLLGKALRFVGDIIKEITKAITWLLDKLGLVNAELDKQGDKLAKSSEAAKKAIEAQNQAYDDQIAVTKAAGKSTINLEKQKQDNIIKTNKLLVEQTIAYVRSGGVLSDTQNALLTEQLKAIKAASVAKEVIVATVEKEGNEKAKKRREEKAKEELDARNLTLKIRGENADAKAKDDLRLLEEMKQANIASQKAMYDEMNAEAEAQSIIEMGQANQRAKDQAEAYRNSFEGIRPYLLTASNQLANAFKGIGSELGNLAGNMVSTMTQAFETISDKSKSNTEKVLAGLNAVGSLIGSISGYLSQQAEQDAKEVEAGYERQTASLTLAKDTELAKEGITAEQKIAIENKYKQQDYQLKLTAYNKETEIKKKAFEQDKKLKIAQTVISTITGVVSAVTGMISAIPGPVGIILGAVAGVAVAAMGAVQIAKISETKFDAGTPPSPPTLTPPSTGAGADSVGSQDAPNLKRIERTPSNSSSDSDGSSKRTANSNEPIRAYVVSQDITTAQNKNDVIERRSSF